MYIQNSFSSVSSTTYSVGDAYLNPRFASGDFNGDGKMDFVMRRDPSSGFSSTVAGNKVPVSFFIQSATGNFTQDMTMNSFGLTQVGRIKSADINGDGKSDLIIGATGQDQYSSDGKSLAITTGDYVWIYKSTSTSNFETVPASTAPLFIHNIDIGDINGDGFIDVIGLTIDFGKSSYLMINDGRGNFKIDTVDLPKILSNNTAIDDPKNTNRLLVYSFTTAIFVDANCDGVKDLMVLPEAGCPNGLVFLNDGKGNFTKSTPINVATNVFGDQYSGYKIKNVPVLNFGMVGPSFLDGVSFDVNGDGKDDVISIATLANVTSLTDYNYYQGTKIQVLISKGDGSFVDESATRILDFSTVMGFNYNHYDSITVFDINGDGAKDLILTRAATSNAPIKDNQSDTRILLNDGSGRFTDSTKLFGLKSNADYYPVVVNGKITLIESFTTSTNKVNANGINDYNLTINQLNSNTVASDKNISNNETLNGSSTSDVFVHLSGNDKFIGNGGLDFAQIEGQSSAYALSKTGTNYFLKGSDTKSGSVTLAGIGRISFTDKSIALDLDGNAGTVVKVLGAVFGKASSANKSYVGIGLSYVDKGMSYGDLAALALNAAGSKTPDQIVTTLWTNVIGSTPSATDKAPFIQMLASGTKAGDLAVMAADSSFNTNNINLTGLVQSGIEYTPA